MKPSDRKKQEYHDFIYDSSIDLKDRSFIAISLVIILSFLVSVPCGLIMREPIYATIATLVASVLFILLVRIAYQTGKIKPIRMIVALLDVLLLMPGFLLTNGGVSSGAPLWVLLGFYFLVMITDGAYRRILSALSVGIIVFCMLLEYYHPEYIVRFSGWSRIFDCIAALLTDLFVISFIVNFQTRLYQRESRNAEDLAKGLEEKVEASREFDAAEESTGTEGEKAVAILTGSMTDLPVYIREKLQIGIIPSKIYTDEGTFYDNIDMDCEEVLRYMGDELKPVSSDAPGVDEYISFFTSELKKAQHLIFITMTPSSSHEYGRATKAAEFFENVTVINSECVSSATGILVMIAAKLAQQNLSVDRIVAEVEEAKKHINCSFVIKTTDVMARRKRISAAMNNLLKTFWLRPMLQTKNDELKVGRMLLGNVRSCYEKYIRVALPKGGTPDTSFAFATYAGMDEEDLLWIEEELKKRGKFERIIFQKASAGITTTCGEGSFGILYLTKSDKDYQLGALFDRQQELLKDSEELPVQEETDKKWEWGFDLAAQEPATSPETEEKWYEKLEGIDPNAAIKNSGSEEAFRTVLKIFYDSIGKKSEELDSYYTTGDWENYTIKVHALKSSAKLIGAMELADRAQSLENAGKAGEVTFIDINHKSFLNEYRKYSDMLSGAFEDSEDDSEKVSVDSAALQSMYQDIRKAAEDMDCDAVDEVVEKLSDIAPPEEERERIKAIIERAGDFDYDGILAVLE